MGKSRYEFNRKDFALKEVRRTARGILWIVAKWTIATLSLAALYYVVFSLFISTEEERRLTLENRLYEKVYPEMQQRHRLNAEVIKGLQERDRQIYEQIFHAEPPSIDPANSIDYHFDPDSVDSRNLVDYASVKAKALAGEAGRVEENFRRIFTALEGRGRPPMYAPIPELNYAQIGASVGYKLNPFIKVPTFHSGLDLIVGRGTPVQAAADGWVTGVTHSKKGFGNTVELSHGNGYVTRYSHLEEIRVGRGRWVRRGTVIGTVGLSGKSFAPHLHYEVLHEGRTEDPVNYLFASLSPSDYANLLYMAAHTEQSLD